MCQHSWDNLDELVFAIEQHLASAAGLGVMLPSRENISAHGRPWAPRMTDEIRHAKRSNPRGRNLYRETFRAASVVILLRWTSIPFMGKLKYPWSLNAMETGVCPGYTQVEWTMKWKVSVINLLSYRDWNGLFLSAKTPPSRVFSFMSKNTWKEKKNTLQCVWYHSNYVKRVYSL